MIIAVPKGAEVVRSNESVISDVHYLYKNPKKSKDVFYFLIILSQLWPI